MGNQQQNQSDSQENAARDPGDQLDESFVVKYSYFKEKLVHDYTMYMNPEFKDELSTMYHCVDPSLAVPTRRLTIITVFYEI